MSCGLTQEELAAFNIPFLDLKCQALFKAPDGSRQICGQLLEDHQLTYSAAEKLGSVPAATTHPISPSSVTADGAMEEKISTIAPAAMLRFGKGQDTVIVSMRRIQPHCLALLDKCADSIAEIVRGFEKPKRVSHVPPHLTKEQLASDNGLRSLEDASRVMCCYAGNSATPSVKLLFMKTSCSSLSSDHLIECYLRSLHVVTERWPRESEHPLDHERMRFVEANAGFFRGEANSSGVTFNIVRDKQSSFPCCEFYGPLDKVAYAVKYVDRIICFDITVPPSNISEQCVQAVIILLDALELQSHSSTRLGDWSGLLKQEWIWGRGEHRGLLKCYRVQSRFIFVAIPEFSEVLNSWWWAVSYIIKNFCREDIDIPSGQPIDTQLLQRTFGLHHCQVDRSALKLTLVGVRDRVQCANNQYRLLLDTHLRSFRMCRVSCPPGGGDDHTPVLLRKHLVMTVNGNMSEAEEVCVRISSSRFRGKVVSAYVEVGASNDGAILVLCGHESVLSDAAETAASELEHVGAKLLPCNLPFGRHELTWIFHNRILEPLNDFAVIESVVSLSPLSSHENVVAATVSKSLSRCPSEVPHKSCDPPTCAKMITMHNIKIRVGEMDFLTAIAEHKCDSLVYAVHPQLTNDFGMAKAVSDLAGVSFAESCASYLSCSRGQGLAVGKAYLFRPYELAKSGLMHLVNTAIPPKGYKSSSRTRQRLFTQAVRHALEVASDSEATVVAVSDMDAAGFGYDPQEAASLTVDAVIDWVREHGSTSSVKTIVMFSHSRQVADKFECAWMDLSSPCVDEGPPPPVQGLPSGRLEEDPCQEHQRPVLPDRQWYWQSPHDGKSPRSRLICIDGRELEFVPFEYDQTLLIESAYIVRKPTIVITECNFAKWEIEFSVDCNAKTFFATNQATGEVRRVVCCLMDLVNPPTEYLERLRAFRCQGEIREARGSSSVQRGRSGREEECEVPFAQTYGRITAQSSRSFSAFIGLVVYGNKENIDLVVESVRSCVSAPAIERQYSLALLRSTSLLSFGQCLEHIAHALAQYGTVVVGSDSTTWTIIIKAIGEDVIRSIEHDICLQCVNILTS